ncbi:phosphopantetheine-binding protein [Streptomyces fagopyri]|uniref:phosphopantetheine-binding protein n=1 Tax=Streptomyces fagopyri TaxID=2662397 RepID=UPI0037123A75
MSPVQSAVTAVLTEKFEVNPESIRPEATLESLDLDSLALAELALVLQEQLGVRVEEDATAKRSTVSELVAALNAERARRGVS